MCEIHMIHCLINTIKICITRINEFIVIFKKMGKCYFMRFFFLSGIYTTCLCIHVFLNSVLNFDH